MNTTLVIPCYNEENRLALKNFPPKAGLHYFFVNDGSNDRTESILSGITRADCSVLNLKQNQGKAEAVRLGMLEALNITPNNQWIGFWDADLATPLDQLDYMFSFLDLNGGHFSAIFGSRVLRLGSIIQRSFIRHIIGRIFVTYSSIMLRSQAYDSQCGAKLFKIDSVKSLFTDQFVSRWYFDLEIIKRMEIHKITALECPLQTWRDVEGSKINPLRDGIKGLIEVFKIRSIYEKK